MFDDFWGKVEYDNFETEIKRVFPDREPEELPMDHPVFHSVFDLKEKPQVPNVTLGIESQYTGITWEREDAKEVHVKAIRDDKGRIMVIICHNTDLGDGWEDPDVHKDPEETRQKALKMGANIIRFVFDN